ncbi:MAG: hypothetical protein Kow0068_01130 [Marinilabiliales bacterium]
MVNHITLGDKDFGFLKKPVRFLFSFPDQFSKTVEEVKKLPPTFLKTPADFTPVNKLDTDIVVLTTYSNDDNSRTIALYNLRNDSVLYKWNVKNPHQEHDRIMNPILLPNKNIIYNYAWVSGFRRIDSLGNIIWQQDSMYGHHAMNLDKHGNIWTVAQLPFWYASGMYKLNGRTVFYIDDYIVNLDVETGRILKKISITDILRDNGLANVILKSQNIVDPLHTNDVQPALKTTKYYNEDDLFISIKGPSIVIQYRPSTNKVIRVIEGIFSQQHDVDFLNDTTLVLFNNNYYCLSSEETKEPPKDSVNLKFAGNFYSNLVKYDFYNDKLSFLDDSVFIANKIFTWSEGLVDYINPSMYYIEQQNQGVLWIIKNKDVVYKNVLKSQHEGYHHLPNWIRIVHDYE